ncbi:hypothetical protein SAMD00023353_0302940 [Rosellinia necatrix]|uniref:Involucrin repeat protein n=1 Tax=Rosellinia necatrix TaxID=77044 RepID=A0A1W2TDT4_ROSNE|nr:hypothetical protein SAMD00023353_0302940 [Rosellinia necatrix]
MMPREHPRRRSPESSRRRRKERRDSREQHQSQTQSQPQSQPPQSQHQGQHHNQYHNQHHNQHQSQHKSQHKSQHQSQQPSHPIPIPSPPFVESSSQSHQQPYQQSYRQPYQEPYQESPQELHHQPYREPYLPDSPAAHNRDRGLSSSYSNSSSTSSTSSSLVNISRPGKKFGIGTFFSGDSRKHRRRIKKRRSKILRFGNSSSSSVGSDLAYGRGYVDRRRSREFSPPTGDSDTGRPRPPRRRRTDEEILDLGRKFAELARQQNDEDLQAAGITRPSTLVGAVAALNQFRRTNSGRVSRGVGNSRPRRDSSPDDSEWESASSDDESDESVGDSSDSGLAYGSSHHLPGNSEGSSSLGASTRDAQPHSQDTPLNRKRSLVDPKLFGPVNSLRGFVQTPCGFERVDRSKVADIRQRFERSTPVGETAMPIESRPLRRVYPVPTADPSHFDVGSGSIISGHQDLMPRSRHEPLSLQQPRPIAPVYNKVFDSTEANVDDSKARPPARVVAPTIGIGIPSAASPTPWSSDAAIGALLKAAQAANQKKLQDSPVDYTNWQPQRSGDGRSDRRYEESEGHNILHDVAPEIPHQPELEVDRNFKREVRHQKRRGSDHGHSLERENRRHDSYRDMDPNVEAQHQDYVGDRGEADQRDSRREGPREDLLLRRMPKYDIPVAPERPSIELPRGAIDPFQYQVADDAFPTPRHGTPTQPLPAAIVTVEREPDFSKFALYESHERLSRKDSFERELRHSQNVDEATPISHTSFVTAAEAKTAEQGHKRSPERDVSSRDPSRHSNSSSQPRDPVQDDADRAYREARRARRIVEQEERSRSNSPDASLIDKWKDKKDSANVQVVSPPTVDHPKPKNPYDGPNADVRIDNILEHPKELSRFLFSESRHRLPQVSVFSARDPSAERERPVLNLVRPTPSPSPTRHGERFKPLDLPLPSAGVGNDSAPIAAQDEIASTPAAFASEAVSLEKDQMRGYMVESPEPKDDPYSATDIVIPILAPTSQGDVTSYSSAAAETVAAVGVGIIASSTLGSVVEVDAARERVELQDFGARSKSRPTLQSDVLYDDPPIPGPKPASPRSSEAPGRFAEDPVFMANIAAGLENSGFDPNLIIDDLDFHRRESPPGSNEISNPSLATNRSTGDNYRAGGHLDFSIGESQDTSTDEKDLTGNMSEISPKLSKRERRRQKKPSEQNIFGKHPVTAYDDIAPLGNEVGGGKQTKQDMATVAEGWGDDRARGGPSSDRAEPEPVSDGWEDMPLKKKKPKKSRRATVTWQDASPNIQRNPQPTRSVELSDIASLIDTPQDIQDDKSVGPSQPSGWTRIGQSFSFNWDVEPVGEDNREPGDHTEDGREERIASSKDKRDKKKPKRESVADQHRPSKPQDPELRHGSSFGTIESEAANRGFANSANSPEKSTWSRLPLSDDEAIPISIGVAGAEDDTSNREARAEVVALPVDDWNAPTKWDTPLEGESSLFRGLAVGKDAADGQGQIADNSGDLREKKTQGSEDEWVDLPKRSKKRMSAYDGTKDGNSPLPVSQSDLRASESPRNRSMEAFVTNASAPYTWLEDDEETREEKVNSMPDRFSNDEISLDNRELASRATEWSQPQRANESRPSSFFDRIKSSIGFSEGNEPTQKNDNDKRYFLDDAGTFGTSAGLMHAAFALARRKYPNEAGDGASETALPPPKVDAVEQRLTSLPQAELIDPEIVEREIRPAIDPTYGDLLPLPPSRPSTPVPTLDESVPPLPESRPGTPEDERERLLLTQRSTHVRRRSETPLRVKTRSQSAIPIQFRLGQRTTPISPGVMKPSPSASPVTSTPDSAGTSKSRARPMSWESTRAFKPLLLVERTTRESVVTPTSFPEESQPSDSSGDKHETEALHQFPPTSIAHDNLQDSHPVGEARTHSSQSPQLPPLRPAEEPHSPTSGPDPIDPVSKNRSSFLLYSSPPSIEDSKDIDFPDSSPILRAVRRRAVLNELKEDATDHPIDNNPLRINETGSPTDILISRTVVGDHIDSQEILTGPKGDIVADISASSTSMQPDLLSNVNETDIDDIKRTEVTAGPTKKPKRSKRGKATSREIQPLVQAASVAASVDTAVSLSGDMLDLAMASDKKEDGLTSAISSEKDETPKKTRSQEPVAENNVDIKVTVPIEDQENEFFDTPTERSVTNFNPREDNADNTVDTYGDIPYQGPIEIASDIPENTFADVSTVVSLATTEAPVKITNTDPVASLVQAPIDVSVEVPEAPIEYSIEALRNELVKYPLEPTLEGIETTVEAPIQVMLEASLEVPSQAPVEVPIPASIEVPAQPTVGTDLDGPVEGQTKDSTGYLGPALADATIKTPAEALAGPAVQTPSHSLVEGPVEVIKTTVEAAIGDFVAPSVPDLVGIDTQRQAETLNDVCAQSLVDTPVSKEPLAKTKKGKKKNRKSRDLGPEAETQSCLAVSEASSQQHGVTNERAAIEDLPLPTETELLKEPSPVISETSPNVSEKDKMKDKFSAASEQADSITGSTLDADLVTEFSKIGDTGSETAPRVEVDLMQSHLEHAQRLPTDVEELPFKLKDVSSEDIFETSTADKDQADIASKRSKKKKKKGRSSEVSEPESKPSSTVDTGTDIRTVEQTELAELHSSNRLGERSFVDAAIPLDHATSVNNGSLANVIVEVIGAGLSPDKLEPEPGTVDETPQPLNNTESATTKDESTLEEHMPGTQENDGYPVTQLGDSGLVLFHEHDVVSSDVENPQAPEPAGEGHSLRAATTENSGHISLAHSFGANNPANTLPNALDNSQTLPSDQSASDKLSTFTGEPEIGVKKKSKKNRKTQSISNSSITQDIPNKNVLSTQAMIESPLITADTTIDPKHAISPLDDISSNPSRLVSRSSVHQTGEKGIGEPDALATEGGIQLVKSELAKEEYDTADPGKPATIPLTELIPDDLLSNSLVPAKKPQKKGTKSGSMIDLSPPTEDISEPAPEIMSSAVECTVGTDQQVAQFASVSTAEAGGLTERKLSNAQVHPWAVSDEKSKKDRSNRAPIHLESDAGNAIPEKGPAGPTIGSTADQTDFDVTQVVSNINIEGSWTPLEKSKDENRQSVALEDNGSATEPSGPISISERMPITEDKDIPGQVRIDTSISLTQASPGSKKKDKKKKRRSVQFAEPIEAPAEIPAERINNILAADNLPLSIAEKPTTLAASSNLLPDALRDLDQGREEYSVEDSAELPTDFDPASVPLPSEEEPEIYLPSVSSSSIPPCALVENNNLLKEIESREPVENADQNIAAQPRDDIDRSVHTKPQNSAEIQAVTEAQNTAIYSETISDVTGNTVGFPLHDDKLPGNVSAIAEEDAAAAIERGSALPLKKGKENNHEEKPPETQEFTLNPRVLSTDMSQFVPAKDGQEATSSALSKEGEAEPHESTQSEELPTAKKLVLDTTPPEPPTTKEEKGEKNLEMVTKASDVVPMLSFDASYQSTTDGEVKSGETLTESPISTLNNEASGLLTGSDLLGTLSDDQRSLSANSASLTPRSHIESSQGETAGSIVMVEPECEPTAFMESITADPLVREQTLPLTSEPEPSIEPQLHEQQSLKPSATLTSNKEKKGEERESEVFVDQPETTDHGNIGFTSSIETPVSVVGAEQKLEPLLEAAEGQGALTEYVEAHTQEASFDTKFEPGLVMSTIHFDIEKPIDPSMSLGLGQVQLSVDGEATLENVDQIPIKIEEAKERADVGADESHTVVEKEPRTENVAAVATSADTGLDASVLPGELKGNDNTHAIPTNKSKKKGKKKEKLAGLPDENISAEPAVEFIHPAADILEQDDAGLTLKGNDPPADGLHTSQDTPQIEVADVNNILNAIPTMDTHGKDEDLTTVFKNDAMLEAQPEPMRLTRDHLVESSAGISTEVPSSPTHELLTSGNTQAAPTSTRTKKSKKAKKKKTTILEQDSPSQVTENLIAPVTADTEQPDPIAVAHVNASEDTKTVVESVSDSPGSAREEIIAEDATNSKEDRTPPTNDIISSAHLSLEETALDDAISKGTASDVNTTREIDTEDDMTTNKEPSDDSTPRQKNKKSKKKKRNSTSEDQPVAGPAEEVAESVTITLEERAEKDLLTPKHADSENVTDSTAPNTKQEKKKKKKKQSLSTQHVSTGISTIAHTLTATTTMDEPDKVQALTSPTELLNKDSSDALAGEGEGDRNKIASISSDSRVLEGQPTEELILPTLIASDMAGLANEPLASESSHADVVAQPTPTNKKEKKKKKNKQGRELGDEVPHEVLKAEATPNDNLPKEGSAYEKDLTQEEPTPEESRTQEIAQDELEDKASRELIQEPELQGGITEQPAFTENAPPPEDLVQGRFPQEKSVQVAQDQAIQEKLLHQDLPEELPRELAGEDSPNKLTPQQSTLEGVSDIARGAISLEAWQITPQQEMQAEVSSQFTTIPNSEEPAIDESTKTDVQPEENSSTTSITRSEKGENNKKQISSGDVDAASHELILLPANQPPPASEIMPDVVLPRESDATEAVVFDVNEQDLPYLGVTTAEIDETNSQTPPEASLAQEPAVVSLDVTSSVALDSRERTEVEAGLTNASREEGVIEPVSTTVKQIGGEMSQSDECSSRPEPGQEPDTSIDVSLQAPGDEAFTENSPSQKNKKTKKKKKKRASGSEFEPEAGIQTGDRATQVIETADAVVPGRANDTPALTEQSVSVIEDHEAAFRRDGVPSPQESEPTFVQEPTLSTELDDHMKSNTESKHSEVPTVAISEDTRHDVPATDQQATPQVTQDERAPTVTLEMGTGIDNHDIQPQEPEATQPKEPAPKVDDGIDTALSKKSKKDKKKKKRASQVSWEPEPDAGIEDLPQQQQPMQAFDEQPMTSQPMEMGSSAVVKDPSSGFASDNKGQDNDVLLDHQSLAEGTQTSLKPSTNLDDTFLETTPSKKSKKKKKKASQSDWDADPAVSVFSEPATNTLSAEQPIVDKPVDLDDTPLTKARKTKSEHIANAQSISALVISPEASKNNESRANEQSPTTLPDPRTHTPQAAVKDYCIGGSVATEIAPDVSRNTLAADDSLGKLEEPSRFIEEGVTEQEPHDLLPEDTKLSAHQAQSTEELIQDGSAAYDPVTSTTPLGFDATSAILSESQNELALASKLKDASDRAASGDQSNEARQNTVPDSLRDAAEESPMPCAEEPRKEKKAKRAPALGTSETEIKVYPGTTLQSWDWSNIDNEPRSQSPVAEAVSVVENSCHIEPLATIESKDTFQAPYEQERDEDLRREKDNVPSNKTPLYDPDPQFELGLKLEPQSKEIATTLKKPKRDKKKKRKELILSEPSIVSDIQAPQTSNLESGSSSQNSLPPESTIREAAAPAETLSAEGNSRTWPIVPDEYQEPAATDNPIVDETSEVENHSAESQGLSVADEAAQPQQSMSVADGALIRSQVNVPSILEKGQVTISIPRPRTSSPNRETSITVDTFPGQLGSHTQHNRTVIDAMVPGPIPTIAANPSLPMSEKSDSQTANATAADLPWVFGEDIQRSKKGDIVDYLAEGPAIINPESDPVNTVDPQAASEQEERQVARLTLGVTEALLSAVTDASSGEPHGDKLSAKPRDLSGEAAQEIKIQAASEELSKFTQPQDRSIGDTHAESPVAGRGLATGLLRPSDIYKAASPVQEASAVKQQDSWDNLDTSEPLKDENSILHAGTRDIPDETFIPSVPPPRTPSALDFSRSLPPVEEETHEDLQKELQFDRTGTTQIRLDTHRDNGFIIDSPNLTPQRGNLGLEEDAGQGDNDVRMRDRTEVTAARPSGERTNNNDSSKTAPDSAGESNSSQTSQTPQLHERRSRRSLFDHETPKLSTPPQGRGWDRGGTPEKPTGEEPLKRAATPLKSTPIAPITLQQQHQDAQQTQRSVSSGHVGDIVNRGVTPQSESAARRSGSNMSISRLQTPDLAKFRTDSPSSHSVHSIHSIRSLRSSGTNTPPLRRVGRRISGDLRSVSHNSSSNPSLPISTNREWDKDPTREPTEEPTRDTARQAPDRHGSQQLENITPIANEGRIRAKDMTDVYDGYGEGRIGSPRSPTRPPSMRRRQSMQVLELEARVEQLLAENRALADARANTERNLHQRNTSAITDRDAEIESLKASLQWLQNEVTRLTEVNEGLQSANGLLALQHNEKYTQLESQHTTAARELDEHRGARDRFAQTLQAKDAEIQELRNQLEAAKEQIREMKQQILAAKPPDADFLRLKDEDHFDHRCQQLYSHVQQWVLRFSKFSDMRACRLTSEINDEKIIDRLDNTILDGSDVDDYLSDRVARRDIFLSMTMNMIWEFVFTRYLFGMDREQRQKLKSLEKTLTDVGPTHAVRQWRAITLTLLSRRAGFVEQCSQDREAVVQAILQTLSMILPPPSNLESQIQYQLRRVMREAVDLSIEMRTQRAEYMMLPPLQPEYDANGELTQTVKFNASLMNDRSGDSSTTNEAYEAKGAIVRCVLFPLVVKKGDDNGIGDDEIVVSPAQVLVAKPRRSTIRMVTPSSDAGGVSLVGEQSPSACGQSNVSVNMQDTPLTPEYV